MTNTPKNTLLMDVSKSLLDEWEWDDAMAGAAYSGYGATSTKTTTTTTTPTPLTQVLYLTEPGTTTPVSVTDIYQGAINDCFLLASIGEIAFYNPSFITNMIKSNTNGTETVTLYSSSTGTAPAIGATAFKAITKTVTNVFPTNAVNSGTTQGVVGTQKEIWPQVIENAYAQANGGYAGISNGGNPCVALEELTGRTANYVLASKLTLTDLMSHIAAKDLIVMDTPVTGTLPYGLTNNHSYMFEGIVTVGGVANVQLGNPLGTNQPSLIPFASLSKGIVEVDFGHYV